MTPGMRKAMEAVRDGKVRLSAAGNLVYNAREVNPSSLAACRRHGFTTPDHGAGRIVPTVGGVRAMGWSGPDTRGVGWPE